MPPTTSFQKRSAAARSGASPTRNRHSSNHPNKNPKPCGPPAPFGPNIDGITVGIDLGDKQHAICVIDATGETIDARKISNHRESLRRLSKKFPTSRMVMEVGSHSPWISRFFSDLEHEVIVANTRKSDELDALILAKLGRVDPSLLHPIAQQGEQELY